MGIKWAFYPVVGLAIVADVTSRVTWSFTHQMMVVIDPNAAGGVDRRRTLNQVV